LAGGVERNHQFIQMPHICLLIEDSLSDPKIVGGDDQYKREEDGDHDEEVGDECLSGEEGAIVVHLQFVWVEDSHLF